MCELIGTKCLTIASLLACIYLVNLHCLSFRHFSLQCWKNINDSAKVNLTSNHREILVLKVILRIIVDFHEIRRKASNKIQVDTLAYQLYLKLFQLKFLITILI